MKYVAWSMGQIITGFAFLWGLCATRIITPELAIAAGLLIVMMMLSAEGLRRDIRRELRQEFAPAKNMIVNTQNATAEIQKWLAERFRFIPLHRIHPGKFAEEDR